MVVERKLEKKCPKCGQPMRVVLQGNLVRLTVNAKSENLLECSSCGDLLLMSYPPIECLDIIVEIKD